MSKMRRYSVAGATLACALGIGHLMEATARTPERPAATESRMAGAIPGVEIAARSGQAATLPHVPRLPGPGPLPAALPGAIPSVPATGDRPAAPSLPQEEAAAGFLCQAEMTATPLPAGMVDLRLTAPCRIRQSVTIDHEGMRFATVTDDRGMLELQMPALRSDVVISARFADGEGAVAETTLESSALYDRFVVQSAEAGGFSLHALEYGAGIGEAGHVRPGARHDMRRAASGRGGFLTRLGGDDPGAAHAAEVYTFPNSGAGYRGGSRVFVEAEVTDGNCGRDLRLQVLTARQGGAPQSRDVTLAMPDCEAVGDFLVLKNIFDDLKIAGN